MIREFLVAFVALSILAALVFLAVGADTALATCGQAHSSDVCEFTLR